MANVKVLTVADVEIKKWRWWSDWIDIAVFDYGGCGHLLQMSISRTNCKRFKCKEFSDILSSIAPSIEKTGDLIDINEKVKE